MPLGLSRLNQFFRRLFASLIHLIRRHPNIMAVVGFTAGTLSFILVQRQAETSRIIALFMLLTWVWLILEKPIRHLLVGRLGFKLSPYALKFATQLVHQESLFFALPFFVITTTWGDPQMLFTALLILAAAVSVVDPVYYKRITGTPWLYPLYHGFALFALLLTGLPIVLKLTTPTSYLLALVVAGLVSIPTITRTLPIRRWWTPVARTALLATLGLAGWLFQPWVPPATLWVTDIAITHSVSQDRVPENRLFNVSADRLSEEGLLTFTAVRAPLGLHERIYHLWYHDGELIDRIALDIDGGREAGYRSWSRKEHFPSNPDGRWDVRVITEGNQLIGRHTFVVMNGPDQAL